MKSFFINKNSQVRSGFKIASTFGSFFLATNIISFLAIICLAIIMISKKRVAIPNLMNYLNGLSDINTSFGILINLIQCV